MRSVRCDACGTKALMAASQCPKCGHLFEVRDGSGEALPLAHCPDCDAYYPAHVQSCKWCGTTLIPEKAHKGDSSRLRWVAAGTFAVAVVLGLIARDPSPKPASSSSSSSSSASHARASAQPTIKTAALAETLARVSSPALTDTAGAIDGTSAPTTAAMGDVSTPPRVTSTVLPRNRRSSSSWDRMVARHWVIVRTDASRSAHVVASVGPNAHVQLGETRGSWRRIKLRGIAGWVDVSGESFAAVRSARSRSTSHVASTARR